MTAYYHGTNHENVRLVANYKFTYTA